jgi:hypothetical protein
LPREKIWKSVALFHHDSRPDVEKNHRFRLHIAGQDVELLSPPQPEQLSTEHRAGSKNQTINSPLAAPGSPAAAARLCKSESDIQTALPKQ